MSRRLMDYDPETRVSAWHHYDDATNTTTIQTSQDVEPILERAKKLANDKDRKKKGIKNNWMLGAMIPIGVQMKWYAQERERGVPQREADWVARAQRGDKVAQRKIVARINNDPEYRYLKTIPGKI